MGFVEIFSDLMVLRDLKNFKGFSVILWDFKGSWWIFNDLKGSLNGFKGILKGLKYLWDFNRF